VASARRIIAIAIIAIAIVNRSLASAKKKGAGAAKSEIS
jgi:hypothetical protein